MRAHAFMRMEHTYMKHMRLTEGDLVLAAGCNLLGAPWALMVSSQVVEWHSTPDIAKDAILCDSRPHPLPIH